MKINTTVTITRKGPPGQEHIPVFIKRISKDILITDKGDYSLRQWKIVSEKPIETKSATINIETSKDTNLPNVDAKLLNLLDNSVAVVEAELPNLTTEEIDLLLRGERAGKTRKTLVAAIKSELESR